MTKPTDTAATLRNDPQVQPITLSSGLVNCQHERFNSGYQQRCEGCLHTRDYILGFQAGIDYAAKRLEEMRPIIERAAVEKFIVDVGVVVGLSAEFFSDGTSTAKDVFEAMHAVATRSAAIRAAGIGGKE